MFHELYVREKLADLDRRAGGARVEAPVVRVDPPADVPRSGIGLKHEVFRRITGDPAPKRSLWQRLTA